MTTPKKTKFRAILKLENAILELYDTGFSVKDIKEITLDIIKRNITLKEKIS